MSEVIRSAGGIWTRLFDHRPFLYGELKFMLIEFEEKRADREIESLFSVIENATEINDNQIDRLHLLSSSSIPPLLERLNEALKEGENILNAEKSSQEDTTLEKKREERKQIWTGFIANIKEKYTRIDNAFEQKEEELKDLYADLEHKLNITTKMATRGYIIDPTIYIKPSKKLKEYLSTLERQDDMPRNLTVYVENNIKDEAKTDDDKKDEETPSEEPDETDKTASKVGADEIIHSDVSECLTVSDLKWLLNHLENVQNDGNYVYLHELLEGSNVILPENEIIKRNPVLEARCVRLRKDQMNRNYRAMTKNVDNVRARQPEETIAYQLKNVNRQLIAVAQFIMSVAAGFLFGFLGVELMIGRLDFGFRLLLGVMCALVIALAEIYFLAKKLTEDLNIQDTIQLGGPPVFPKKPHND